MIGATGLFLIQTGCSPSSYSIYKTEVINNTIEIPLDVFNKSALQIVRPKGWLFDIAVNKKQDNTYTALLLKCTHQSNQLNVSSKGFHCSLHGSDFSIDGGVKKGPAEKSLKQYTVNVQQNNLIINI